MKANGLYDIAAAMIANPSFQQDAAYRSENLKALRRMVKDAAVPEWMAAALTTLQNAFPTGISIRCRSSTNNEDLTGYSGAGLYDSFTHHPHEGHLSKTIKQVYASVWEDRAFDEREFYRVDHLLTAMGVLVHPNFDDEQSNGVGVTKNLIDPAWTGYYINAQVGENLVTNPENGAVPEEFLIAQLLGNTRYTIQYVTFSSLLPEGQKVLTSAQAELLADQMAKIHSRFQPLYGYPPDFAMELEWKIDAQGRLAIKQARPWID
jgi:phosphoenolpyruvate synthase/pyruvate phosphate dikinase